MQIAFRHHKLIIKNKFRDMFVLQRIDWFLSQLNENHHVILQQIKIELNLSNRSKVAIIELFKDITNSWHEIIERACQKIERILKHEFLHLFTSVLSLSDELSQDLILFNVNLTLSLITEFQKQLNEIQKQLIHYMRFISFAEFESAIKEFFIKI